MTAGRDASLIHRPVMFEEALEALALEAGARVVDATFGRGGHARGMLERIGPQGVLHVFDRDPEAVAAARALGAEDVRVRVHHRPFAEMDVELAPEAGRIDGVLMDLGVSSPQLDDPGRGFSFSQDGPLDMRMGVGCEMSAAQWIARATAEEMATVFRDLGEERHARRIAGAIAREREEEAIETTGRLADIVSRAHPAWERDRHPATRVFMAIRMHVNDELGQVRRGLEAATGLLAPGGRLVAISFHSLEDRIVKRFIRDEERGDLHLRRLPVPESERDPRLVRVGGARRPGADEVAANPRARSAIMRVAQRPRADGEGTRS